MSVSVCCASSSCCCSISDFLPVYVGISFASSSSLSFVSTSSFSSVRLGLLYAQRHRLVSIHTPCDLTGMGADLLGSFAEASCAALVVASVSPELSASWTAMLFPLR